MASVEPVELKSVKVQSVQLQSVSLGSCIDLREETELETARRRNLRDLRERIRSKQFDPNPGKIRMFGIKCNFGTDDFFFLSLFALAIKAAW